MTLRARLLLIPLIALCLLLAFGALRDQDTQPTALTEAEAVRVGWDSAAPPPTGWTKVQLPDLWAARWPEHDGVTWYRLRWRQDDARRPVAIMVDQVTLAGAIYVNGSLIARDRHLTEPLSRHWAMPQYFLLSAPMLRKGENLLMIRVSGLARYKPGLGKIEIGAPAAIDTQFRRATFVNYDLKLISIVAALTMAALFLLIWLLRRRDGMFGWIAVAQFCASLYYYNFVAREIWPFQTTDGWQMFVGISNMLAGAAFATFLLRYGDAFYLRVERWAAAACLVATMIGIVAPRIAGHYVGYYHLAGVLFYYAGVAWFARHAIRMPRPDNIALLVCQSLPVLASAHDLALYFDWIRGDSYLFGASAMLALLGGSFAVAYRLVGATRRIEQFNAELQAEVAAATAELSATLEREHRLAIAHSRAGERLRIVRDLHDGFGGMLVSAIARMENAPGPAPGDATLAMLKAMRNDLRLVIDQTMIDQGGLVEMLAPLRHRSGQLLETAGIELDWHLNNVDNFELDGRRGLNLLRFLQEGLTNIFSHSGATRARVEITRDGDRLLVCIADNGRGIAPARAGHAGAGMESLRQRAAAMGGALAVHSSSDGTRLDLAFPTRPRETADADG